MDNKKRAQAAWALLLALLSLLFIPQLRSGRSGSGESPSEDPWQEEDAQQDEQGDDQQAGEGTDGGWYDDSDDVSDPNAPVGTPEGGGHTPGVDPNESDDLPTDPAEEYPADDDDSSDSSDDSVEDPLPPQTDQGPTGGSDGWDTGDDTSPDGGGETTYGDESPATGYPGHAPTGGSDDTTGGFDIPGYAHEDALDGVGELTWAGEFAGDVAEWGADNPKQALILTGATAAAGYGGYLLVSASSGSAMAVTASEASNLAAVGVPMTAATNVPDDVRDRLEDVVPSDSSSGAGGGSQQKPPEQVPDPDGVDDGDGYESDPWDDENEDDVESAPETTVPEESDPTPGPGGHARIGGGDDDQDDSANDDVWNEPADEDDEAASDPALGYDGGHAKMPGL